MDRVLEFAVYLAFKSYFSNNLGNSLQIRFDKLVYGQGWRLPRMEDLSILVNSRKKLTWNPKVSPTQEPQGIFKRTWSFVLL